MTEQHLSEGRGPSTDRGREAVATSCQGGRVSSVPECSRAASSPQGVWRGLGWQSWTLSSLSFSVSLTSPLKTKTADWSCFTERLVWKRFVPYFLSEFLASNFDSPKKGWMEEKNKERQEGNERKRLRESRVKRLATKRDRNYGKTLKPKLSERPTVLLFSDRPLNKL